MPPEAYSSIIGAAVVVASLLINRMLDNYRLKIELQQRRLDRESLEKLTIEKALALEKLTMEKAEALESLTLHKAEEVARVAREAQRASVEAGSLRVADIKLAIKEEVQVVKDEVKVFADKADVAIATSNGIKVEVATKLDTLLSKDTSKDAGSSIESPMHVIVDNGDHNPVPVAPKP